MPVISCVCGMLFVCTLFGHQSFSSRNSFFPIILWLWTSYFDGSFVAILYPFLGLLQVFWKYTTPRRPCLPALTKYPSPYLYTTRWQDLENSCPGSIFHRISACNNRWAGRAYSPQHSQLVCSKAFILHIPCTTHFKHPCKHFSFLKPHRPQVARRTRVMPASRS